MMPTETAPDGADRLQRPSPHPVTRPYDPPVTGWLQARKSGWRYDGVRARGVLSLLIAWLVSALLIVAPTQADSLGGSADAASNHIAAQLIAEGSASPGGTTTLAIAMSPAPGWHGYWLNPGDAGFPMRLSWHLPAGAQAGVPEYPVPHTLLLAGLMNHVYESAYAVLVPLTLPPGVATQSVLPVSVDADWLACSATTCVPEHAHLATTVTVGAPGASDPRFDAWRAALPAPLGSTAHWSISGRSLRLAIPLPASVPLSAPHVFVAGDGVVDYAAPQSFARVGDTLVATLARSPSTNASPLMPLDAVLSVGASDDSTGATQAPRGFAFAASGGPVPTGGTPVDVAGAQPTKGPPLALLLLAAFTGGLILNIMPCVFPILSLKALSLARAGGHEGEARAEGLAYTAGVVLACAGLGALLLGLRAGGAQIGWAFQLQDPFVVAGLLALAIAITANLLGLYEFAVPGFVQTAAPLGKPETGGRGKLANAFGTGLLAAFVATPCTGPFMAGAMGAALLLPILPAMLLFVALGLGLALPFLAIAFVPALRRLLPRPGAWMNGFRRAMAVPMALTAVGLLWLASRLGSWHFAGVAGVIAAVLLALLAMLGDAQRKGESVARRFAVLCVLLLASAAVILPRAIRAPDANTGDAGEILAAQPYSETALDAALAGGHPVFAFFTADWCLTCKVNERVAIERATTRDAFARAGVVVLEGDWTRRDAEITRTLTAHGAAGVPLYLWYDGKGKGGHTGPGSSDAVVLPQLLTPDMLAALPKRP